MCIIFLSVGAGNHKGKLREGQEFNISGSTQGRYMLCDVCVTKHNHCGHFRLLAVKSWC
jgi:hypothetical protein